MTARESEIIGLIRKEVKPALGCTEPIAVALAVAKAAETLEENHVSGWRLSGEYSLKAEVSGNILKNGMGVGIPGTGMVGLHIAAALGAICGKSCYGLEVLHDLNDASIAKAKELVDAGKVEVGIAETGHKLYVKATISTKEEHSAYAVIQDDHDRICETGYDGAVLSTSQAMEKDTVEDQKSTLDYGLTIKEICEFTRNIAYEDISFILESRTLNLALAVTYDNKLVYPLCLYLAPLHRLQNV